MYCFNSSVLLLCSARIAPVFFANNVFLKCTLSRELPLVRHFLMVYTVYRIHLVYLQGLLHFHYLP